MLSILEKNTICDLVSKTITTQYSAMFYFTFKHIHDCCYTFHSSGIKRTEKRNCSPLFKTLIQNINKKRKRRENTKSIIGEKKKRKREACTYM